MPNIEEISGSIFIRCLNNKDGYEPGQEIKGDLHDHDHTTFFFNGLWQAIKERKNRNGEWEIVQRVLKIAPFHLLIEARCRHSFRYLGCQLPDWMEPFLADMYPGNSAEFRRQYENQRGYAWCVYSHYTPQGEVSLVYTGWEAYT